VGTRDYARIFRRSWLLIVVFAIVGTLAAWAVTATTTPRYSATSAAFVSSDAGGTLNELTQGNAFTQQRVNTYAKLITEPIVTEPVIEDFGLDVSPGAFAGDVTVSIPVQTTMLEVTVSGESPAIAASVANALITSLATTVEQIETTAVSSTQVMLDAAGNPVLDAAGNPVPSEPVPPVQITQVRFAETRSTPVSPNLALNLAIGLAAGLALGVLAAILRDLIDTRLRTLDDVEAATTAPIVGAIPQAPRSRSGSILAEDDPGSPTAESFRILRTNLQFLDVDGPATFVVTSPSSGEGKSTVTTNLAASIAATGVRVLVVEADLRRPQVHNYFGVEGGAGLTDILIGRAELADVVQPWRSPNLHILAAGRIPPNPSELLGSHQMRELMTQLQERYDVVLYDTPPVLPVPDAAILSRTVGGVLLVTSIDHTRRDEVRSAVTALEKVNARISGVVANRLPGRGTTSYLAEAYHSSSTPQREPAAESEDSLSDFEQFMRAPGGGAPLDLDSRKSTFARSGRRSHRGHETSP